MATNSRIIVPPLAAACLLMLCPEDPSSTARLHAEVLAERIATGLDNPRGIGFAGNGQLYVAEAGRGGDGNCVVTGNGLLNCYGETGAVTRIDPTGARPPFRMLAGLPSIAPEGGFGATGPHDVEFIGSSGQLVFGLGGVADLRTGLGPKADMLGTVVKLWGRKPPRQSADVTAFETANDPVPPADSNPYGVLALPGRRVVADAGANALFEVRQDGRIRTLAVFPPRQVLAPPFLGLPPGAMIPMQAVPTCLAEGPDGFLYVGQLTGFPFPIGGANVYRVPRRGGTPEVYATGFTNIVDLAFDPSGTLYVLQIGNGLNPEPGPPLASPGSLVRVNADLSHTVVYTGLFYPGGVAFDRDGVAYVTNNGILPGVGEVLRITQD